MARKMNLCSLFMLQILLITCLSINCMADSGEICDSDSKSGENSKRLSLRSRRFHIAKSENDECGCGDKNDSDDSDSEDSCLSELAKLASRSRLLSGWRRLKKGSSESDSSEREECVERTDIQLSISKHISRPKDSSESESEECDADSKSLIISSGAIDSCDAASQTAVTSSLTTISDIDYVSVPVIAVVPVDVLQTTVTSTAISSGLESSDCGCGDDDAAVIILDDGECTDQAVTEVTSSTTVVSSDYNSLVISDHESSDCGCGDDEAALIILDDGQCTDQAVTEVTSSSSIKSLDTDYLLIPGVEQCADEAAIVKTTVTTTTTQTSEYLAVPESLEPPALSPYSILSHLSPHAPGIGRLLIPEGLGCSCIKDDSSSSSSSSSSSESSDSSDSSSSCD